MRSLKISKSAILLIILLTSTLQAQQPRPTALVGALDQEVSWLRDQLQDRHDTTFTGRTFTTGRLDGHAVVIVVGGVGKVNAAMTTALLADHFHPSAVIFDGVAGGLNPSLQPGDLIIAAKTVQHDLGDLTADSMITSGVLDPATHKRLPTFLPADSLLLVKAVKAAGHAGLEKVPTTIGLREPKVITGIVASGDVFVSSKPKVEELRRRLAADAVEMEGAAVAQVCYELGLPCLVIRAISDKADENAMQDFEKFVQVAARNANRIVLGVVTEISK